jgi:transposase, IS6 family
VSGRTILRWVQKLGPALAEAVRQHRKTPVTTWLVDETYVKILGKWRYIYRGVDFDGQVLDCWLSATRDLTSGRGLLPANHRIDGLYPRAHRHRQSDLLPECHSHVAPDAKHTATGFYDRVISTNRCERNHGYLKSRLRPMRGLKSSVAPSTCSPPSSRCSWSSVASSRCRVPGCRSPADVAMCAPATLPAFVSRLGQSV